MGAIKPLRQSVIELHHDVLRNQVARFTDEAEIRQVMSQIQPAALREKMLPGSKAVREKPIISHSRLNQLADEDNGVKIVDACGEMLEATWESHATILANIPNKEFVNALTDFVKATHIDMGKPSLVVYARDTRPTGQSLVKALENGLKAIGAEGRDAGIITTPILHYLVKAINTKGAKEEYGEDSEAKQYRYSFYPQSQR